jgi:hypothetical protein
LFTEAAEVVVLGGVGRGRLTGNGCGGPLTPALPAGLVAIVAVIADDLLSFSRDKEV